MKYIEVKVDFQLVKYLYDSNQGILNHKLILSSIMEFIKKFTDEKETLSYNIKYIQEHPQKKFNIRKGLANATRGITATAGIVGALAGAALRDKIEGEPVQVDSYMELLDPKKVATWSVNSYIIFLKRGIEDQYVEFKPGQGPKLGISTQVSGAL